MDAENADTYSIRYDGAPSDAIDLHQLGISLQGFARVLAVTAHLCETGKYNKQFGALSVRVVAKPVEEHHCYEVLATIERVASDGVLWTGLGTAVFMGIVGYVFNRQKGKEMKHLSEALKQALGLQERTVANQQATHTQEQARLLATIERMADALRPAARQAVTPIGQGVARISLRDMQDQSDDPALVTLDQSDKDALDVNSEENIEALRQYTGIISELDMLTGSCKVALSDDPDTRLTATITDPVARQPSNPYAQAMSDLRTIRFEAKAAVNPEGEIVRLYISDVAQGTSPA